MASHLEEGDRRPIAEQAGKGMDPQELGILIGKLVARMVREKIRLEG